MLLSFQTDFNPVNAAVVCVISESISGLVLHVISILSPALPVRCAKTFLTVQLMYLFFLNCSISDKFHPEHLNKYILSLIHSPYQMHSFILWRRGVVGYSTFIVPHLDLPGSILLRDLPHLHVLSSTAVQLF